MKEPIIKVNNASVIYQQGNRQVTAVKPISFTVYAGEIFGIIGSSGAGKSSLVRTLNYLQPVNSGEIIVANQNLATLSKAELRKLRFKIGMIFQNFNLAHSKTVYGNIEFVLKAAGFNRADINKRIMELLELVGLADKKDEYPIKLSGGQKQRVGIARALANQANILLCDEATSALDPETTLSILDLLKKLNQQLNLTIVLITHQIEVIKKICDRVAVMSQGEIVEVDTAFNIFANPQHDFTKQFLQHEQQLNIPEEILTNLTGKLISIKYIQSNATTPILYESALAIGCPINILQGNIEYINQKPIGNLLVEIIGTEIQQQQLIDKLLQNNVIVRSLT